MIKNAIKAIGTIVEFLMFSRLFKHNKLDK